MEIVQPWVGIAGGLVGMVVAGAGVSFWWAKKLKRARRLIERLEASRQQLGQHNTQARRQLETLQQEVGELRVIAERYRRRPNPSVSPPDTLLPLVDPIVSRPAPLGPAAPFLSAEPPARRAFAQTQVEADDDDDDDRPDGFAPTQIDKPF